MKEKEGERRKIERGEGKKKKGGIEERMLRLKLDGKDMRELIDWIIRIQVRVRQE